MKTTTKSKLVINGFYRVGADDVEKFSAILPPHIAETIAQEGCNYYSFSTDLADPTTFRVAEGWRDGLLSLRIFQAALFRRLWQSYCRAFAYQIEMLISTQSRIRNLFEFPQIRFVNIRRALAKLFRETQVLIRQK